MHFMYLAQGESGLLKVGLSTCPQQRCRTLARIFRSEFGDRLHRVTVFPGTYAGFGAESSVLDLLRPLASEVIRREWFRGIGFEVAHDIARGRWMDVRDFQLANPHHFKQAA